MEALIFIPSAVCFGFAGYLALKQRDGWGWFLFVGLMAISAVGGPVTALTVN